MQILVNLSVPTYTAESLWANRKYVYKRLKLQVYKFKRNEKHSDLYAIGYQKFTNAVLKGALLHCKRAPFTLQKGIFYHAKGHLLPCKRASFTLQKSTFCDWVVNLSYKRGGGEIKQSTSDLFYISSNKQRGTLLHLHISFISLGLPEYQKQI